MCPGAVILTNRPAAGCRRHETRSRGRPGVGSRPLGASGAGQAGPSKTVSSIADDRMSVIPAAAVLSKQLTSSPFRFAEIAKEAGIDFVHFSGMTAEKHYPTANGSGVAVFDYNNDGLLDIYFATATLLPLGTALEGPNRLYKNQGGNHFEDVTLASGLGYSGFCHGIIAGDIDNDGDQDVFLCNYGSNTLYLNNGDGTFRDISKQAGVDAPNWSSGGAMLDYDNDGFLDIYVANYGRWIYPDDHHHFGDNEKKIWLYPSPRTVTTVRHLLYHNNGNKTFTDVFDKVITKEREVVDPATQSKKMVRTPGPRADGHGFGVVTADLNGDGLIDIFVANDMNPNFLFLNHGDGTFDDVSEMSGAAFNKDGAAQSGMGVDAEDVDGDGLPELFVTTYVNEYSPLFQNLGNGCFLDITQNFGLAYDSAPWVKWGCHWPTSITTAGPIVSLLTGKSTTTGACSLSRSTTRRSRCCSEMTMASAFGWRLVMPGPISTPGTSAGARPSATSTTTATSTSWSTTRTPRRRCCVTTPGPAITGSGSRSRGPRATVTPSAPGSRSRPPSERFIVSARGATACRRPTILASLWASATPRR